MEALKSVTVSQTCTYASASALLSEDEDTSMAEAISSDEDDMEITSPVLSSDDSSSDDDNNADDTGCPLFFFYDCEGTGGSIYSDHIIELGTFSIQNMINLIFGR